MKNLKKITRINLKSITGGARVACILPNGQTTTCKDHCPADFCGPNTNMCLLPMDLCD
ncbi:bacteriocin-like protein [Chryseobacterium sp. T16E-39]|uniref:bacteriocin-like protein n=1 Tax=Chryseobacterium sp. T16E-39 TaxID=2015076 RepID=UPI0026831545